MNYRKLQQTLKHFRQDGIIEKSFKLNQKKEALESRYNIALQEMSELYFWCVVEGNTPQSCAIDKKPYPAFPAKTIVIDDRQYLLNVKYVYEDQIKDYCKLHEEYIEDQRYGIKDYLTVSFSDLSSKKEGSTFYVAY